MHIYFKRLSVTRTVASLSLMSFHPSKTSFHPSKTTEVLKIKLYLINNLVLSQ